jgi:hypothetical protein
MSTWTRYNFPTTIFSGPGSRKTIITFLQSEGLQKPLVVTDRELSALPIVSDLCQMLREAEIQPIIFADFSGNPIESHVKAGVQVYNSEQADAIIGFGGGAAMDVAKSIALMAHHPGTLFDYEDDKPDALPIDQKIPKIAMIATTAGTGSEVGRSAVISDDQTKIKKIIFSPRLLASIAILDPELTLALPATITATTGFDALSHLLEAYLAKGIQPMCDGIALEGIRIVNRSLRDCFDFANLNHNDDVKRLFSEQRLGDDLSLQRHLRAREDMLNASMMGAVAFQKGLGVTHSCAHALSAISDLHHGLANGILLPYAIKFNSSAVPERLQTIAETLRLPEHNADQVILWLQQLQRELNIPHNLSQVGIKREQIEQLAKYAHADVCHLSNFKPVSIEDFRQLFISALG